MKAEHDVPTYQNYRITYLREDGQSGVFLVREDCSASALIRFQLAMSYPRESVTSVEVQSGRRWVRIS